MMKYMKSVYASEIEAQTIDTMTACINNLTEHNHRDNTNSTVKKSACVVLTSHAGKTLNNVTLNLHRYPQQIRKTVRYWKGSSLQQIEHENVSVVQAAW